MRHRDPLTTLMLARDAETDEAMSDAQRRDEMMTFMSSGHDTTATAMIESPIIMGTLLA